MAAALTRIISDLHLGDRASRAARPAQLRPLLEGVDELVINGDALDTRPGPAPAATAALRAELLEYLRAGVPVHRLITGNHDPDISGDHALDLAGGAVFAVHGDILLPDIVPWGVDAPRYARLIAEEFARVPPARHAELAVRLAVWRRAAAQVPQRHQSERNPVKYALRFAADTLWPPFRFLRILRAWREEPLRAAELRRTHRPRARFVLTGHTHRPGIWSIDGDATLINTGSFCPPLGGWMVDLAADRVRIRQIAARRGEFHPGEQVAEFPLAAG